jgi:hypothetical protein
MTKIVRFFYKTLYWLVPWWYGTTLTLTRRKNKNPEVAVYTNTREIVEAINWGRNWRPDPLKGALDVVMHPRKFQAKINAGDTKFGDCDDHALYWATALLKSGLADRASLGTVWYTKPGGKGVGHVVCVFEKDGDTFWADYRDPRKQVAGDEWAWAKDVAAGRSATLNAAAKFEVRLRRNGSPKLRKRTGKRYLP